MRIQELNGKKVCILGFGKEGQATKRALEHYAPKAAITIRDKKDQGEAYLDGLSVFDVIMKSPGIPPHPALKTHDAKLTTSTQMFFDTIAGSGAVVVGVTGSKGKSTTASLIAAILKAAKMNVHLVGNIGEPAIAHLHDAKRGAIFVCELSSYQLMDLTTSPHIAVVTSIFPEHLDYHGSYEAYVAAKANIARYQNEGDAVIFPARDRKVLAVVAEGEGRKIPFSEEDAPVAVEETKLLGRHNQSNIAAAWMAAKEFGVKEEVAARAIQAFIPLPHRLQPLGVHAGIHWIDDAISTTPDSTIAALDALGDDVSTIILGGTDRGVPYEELGKRIARSSVKTVILFPGSGPRIKKAIEEAQAKVTFVEASSMEEAVRAARKATTSNLQPPTSPIVLLSTASPSYNMFKNFEEKGEAFKRAVQKL